MTQKKQTFILFFMKKFNCQSQPDLKQDVSSCIMSELENMSSLHSKKQPHSSIMSPKKYNDSTTIFFASKPIADFTNFMNVYNIEYFRIVHYYKIKYLV